MIDEVGSAATYESVKRGATASGKAMLARYAVVALLSLAGTTALIRILGPADWAIVAVGYYITAFFDTTFGATLMGALVRSRGRPDPKRVSAAAAVMRVTGVALGFGFCLAALPAADAYGRGVMAWCMVAVGVCAVVYAARATSLALIERKLDYRTVALTEVLDQLGFYAIAILGTLAGGGLGAVLAALALRGVLPAVVLRRREPAPLLGRWRRKEVAALLAFAGPNGAAAIIILVHGLVPLIFLGARQGVDLGFIWTSATIAGYGATLQVIAQRLGFSSLARLVDDDLRFRHAIRRSLGLSTFVVVTAAVPLGALSSLWMPLLLGERWRAAVPVMAWMATQIVLLSAANVSTAALNAMGRTRMVLAINALDTGSYLILSALLVRWSARLGIPVAVCGARCLAAVLSLALLISLLGRWRTAREFFILAVAAGAIPALAALVEHFPLAGTALVLALITIWIVTHPAEVRFLVRSGRAA